MENESVDPFLLETEILLEMNEEDRHKFVSDNIRWLSETLKWVQSAKGKIAMSKRMDRFTKAIAEKGQTIMVCALWSVKTEYREAWVDLLATVVGIEEKVVVSAK